MKRIEDHIKGRLQNHTSNGKVDADKLWSNIEKELPKANPPIRSGGLSFYS